MIQGSIGRRYAKAFLAIAGEQGKAEEFLTELEDLGTLFDASPDIRVLMTDPSFETSARKKALSLIAGPLKLSLSTQNFIKLLIDRERMVCFRDILLSFREQSDELLGRVRVQIHTEEALEAAHEGPLKKILEQITKKKVILEVTPQKGILGGMVIKIQDLVFDGSVKSALERMKEKMMEAAVQ